MRYSILMAAGITGVLGLFVGADAGQIWTDMNGDGLPDGPLPVQQPSTNVTVGVWIDAQSFSWTNFLAYVEWTGDCLNYVSASYVISGGSNFPIDNFSHPRGIGFGGSGYAQGGVDHIGNITLHVNSPLMCCVSPIIDVYNPYYVFSQLGAGSSYMLFSTNPSSCFEFDSPGTGACCSPCDGSCQDLTQEDCVASGGFYWGDGTSCATAFCDVPGPLVCCFPDGSCQDGLNLCQCADAGGINTPAFNCFPGLCPGYVGACCLPSAQCVDLTRDECDQAGGEWFGFNGTCENFTCQTSVQSESWGRIKGLFR